MRTLCAIASVTLFSAALAGASEVPATDLSSLPVSAQAKISASVGEDSSQYHVRPVSGGFQAESAGLKSRFTSSGVQVSSGTTRWGLSLRGYGYGNKLHSVASVEPGATRNRVEYRRGAVTEWYVNGPVGLEQGFTIEKRPGNSNGNPLIIKLQTSGGLTSALEADETSLKLEGAGGMLLRYTGLTAYDARNRQLNAKLRVEGDQLLLQVDDSGAQYPVVVDPVVQLAKLTASDGKASDHLGVSIGMSGNVIVVGTQLANAVYVFVKPPTGWKDMTQTGKLTASDGMPDDLFGVRVAISGDVIVVGAPGVNQNQGAAYVFVKPPTGWKDMTESAKLIASDGAPGDDFGFVAVSGSTVVVSAFNATVNGNVFQGAAYVFTKPGGRWANADRPVLTETAKLTSSDGADSDAFGSAVAIAGETIAIGANLASASRGGEAYVFVKPPSGWITTTETAKLQASDEGGDLGVSIATNGGTVAVGADIAHDNGAVYVYVKPDSGWADMTETAQLLVTKRGWDFANSVAIDGTGKILVVGAPQGNGRQIHAGDAFVFLRPSGGWKTTTKYKYRIYADDGRGGEEFAQSVSLNGSTLAVGAYSAHVDNNSGQGAVYVFAPQ